MNIFKVGRLANAIVGAWLFLSALLIDRTPHQATNVAVVGALSATSALVALYRLPFLRFLNIPLAVWLFISAWLPGQTPISIVNDMLVATLMFGFAAVPIDLDPDELLEYSAHT
jgi:hypothetical protein